MSSEAATLELLNRIRVTNFVLPILSICLTIFRLWERGSNRRLWWDDAWAAFTMVGVLIVMVMFELFLQEHIENPNKYPQHLKIAIYYLCAEGFYVVVWSSRMTILFTIMRVATMRKFRLLLRGVAIVFAMTFVILFAQVFWVCEREPGWKDLASPQCELGDDVAVAQITTDIIADAFLIIAPVRLVWGVKLSWTQKMRIIAIFSSSFITTAVSLYHASTVLRGGGLPEALGAVIEPSVTLIVANLNVVVAFIFRFGAEDRQATAASRGTRDIVTIGSGDPRSKRNRYGGNMMGAISVTTEWEHDGLPPPTTIMLDHLDGDNITKKASGDVADESLDSVQKVVSWHAGSD
ncbi:uncharacterized protein C8Q71DRAFT_437379 [Rhodofomes roseus]|uniref:Rhodopsin domain-containing protein n=1 Tax=Rhodofomes roseus TaxID=34475 RepID=A0ABQ8KR13_9APHY|nr:uncharacterized protein C8Q71DRAFT_437379 [Rhodofomes roseus]KAH9841069.1 hypothetical protein C8Q71DRAFT_437379 [Rhodofomes roseus]